MSTGLAKVHQSDLHMVDVELMDDEQIYSWYSKENLLHENATQQTLYTVMYVSCTQSRILWDSSVMMQANNLQGIAKYRLV